MYIIRHFNRITAEHVGTKAWRLIKLQQKFSVPEFVVVTTLGFREYQKHGNVIPDLERKLQDVFKHFTTNGLVAIRSSSTAEDLSGVSFAGMYETVLGVSNVESGIAAIIRVWQSARASRVKDYCNRMNVQPGQMAVIIQHQLNPDVSGVMVTQNPLAKGEMLIECCRGLGEQLVSGMITPIRYQVRNKKVINRAGDDILPANQISKLIQAGKKIEKIFRAPQDIEWAIEDGNVYFLQSRPVCMTRFQYKTKGRVWCNANVRETMPDPVSPMQYSIFDEIFFPGIISKSFGFSLSRQEYERFRPVERVLGRIYWNVNNTAAFGKAIAPILNFTEADKSIDPQFAYALKSINQDEIPHIFPPFRMIGFSIIAVTRLMYFLIMGFVRCKSAAAKVEYLFRVADEYANKFKPSTHFDIGVKNVREGLNFVINKLSRRYFGGVLISIFYMVLLGKILGIRLHRKGEAIARMTTMGVIDKTGEMVLAIQSLASLAKKKLRKVSLRNLKQLYETDYEFQEMFDGFIKEFGHRGPAEFDIASINWHEDPIMVYNLIVTASCAVEKPKNSTVLHNVLQSFRPMERFFVKLFLPRIRRLTPLRENGKHYVFKVGARVKDQLLVLEKHLRKRKYLKNKRDIFYLTLQDLERIRDAKLTATQTRALVQKRKQEWNRYLIMQVPDIIYEDGRQYKYIDSRKTGESMYGTPVSFGKVKGKARIIKNFNEGYKLKHGEILITHHTDPGWTPLFSVASGVIIEVGGVICHAAMVARELGVPALILKNATTIIKNGAFIMLDADEGKVHII